MRALFVYFTSNLNKINEIKYKPHELEYILLAKLIFLTRCLVITTPNIVRCRVCRAYINPFVNFIDVSRWKCNLCGRINEVPEEFKSNPLTKGKFIDDSIVYFYTKGT